MLKLYYARQSLLARPVWLALLEKHLDFELVPVNLRGEQFEPDFVALNPFSHVPVLIDGDRRIIESLAILDYLEAKYPHPPLLSTDPDTLATIRMVQMVSVNELLPAMAKLIIHANDPIEREYAHLRATNTLNFLEALLADRPYFADDQLTLAEIVAGTLIQPLPDLGIPITDYPHLATWSERLSARPTWQAIQLTAEEWDNFKRHLQVMPKIWQRRRRERMRVLHHSPLH